MAAWFILEAVDTSSPHPMSIRSTSGASNARFLDLLFEHLDMLFNAVLLFFREAFLEPSSQSTGRMGRRAVLFKDGLGGTDRKASQRSLGGGSGGLSVHWNRGGHGGWNGGRVGLRSWQACRSGNLGLC